MNIETKNQININDSKVAILGLGKSGEGAARLANYLGANVIVSDNNINGQIKNISKDLELIGIEVELGQHTKKSLMLTCGLFLQEFPKKSKYSIRQNQTVFQL